MCCIIRTIWFYHVFYTFFVRLEKGNLLKGFSEAIINMKDYHRTIMEVYDSFFVLILHYTMVSVFHFIYFSISPDQKPVALFLIVIDRSYTE